MKKLNVFIVLIIVVSVFGCAGDRYANLKTDENGISHVEKNRSAFLPPVSSIELARAYQIKKDADSRSRMYENLSAGVANSGKDAKGQNGGYLIGYVNNDPKKSAYFFHPEISGLKMPLAPNGGFQVIPVRDIPQEIVLYEQSGRIAKQFNPRYDSNFQEKISHKKIFNGVMVDYVITIHSL